MNQNELRAKYSVEFDVTEDPQEVLSKMREIAACSNISMHYMRAVFFDSSDQLETGVRMRRGMCFQTFYDSAILYMKRCGTLLTKENLSQRGQLVLNQVHSEIQTHKADRVQVRPSVARRQ